MNKRIDQLDSKLQAKNDHIERLAKSLDILEMHSKKNNVIISGLDLQARSYARATSGNDSVEANGTSSQSGGDFAGLRKQVADFVNETMGVQLLTSDIIACHELPSRKDERVKPIILSLINNAVKRDVMMGRKNLKRNRMKRERTTYAKTKCCPLQEGEGPEKTHKHRHHMDVQRKGLPQEISIGCCIYF